VKCDVRLPYRMYVASLHFVFTLFGVSCRDNSYLLLMVEEIRWFHQLIGFGIVEIPFLYLQCFFASKVGFSLDFFEASTYQLSGWRLVTQQVESNNAMANQPATRRIPKWQVMTLLMFCLVMIYDRGSLNYPFLEESNNANVWWF